MTRKEAIEELKRAIEQSCARCIRRNTRGWCEEYCAKPKALDMAIKALEQAPKNERSRKNGNRKW